MRLIMEGNVDGVWKMLQIAEKRLKLEIRDRLAAINEPRHKMSKNLKAVEIIPATNIGNYYGTVMVCRIDGKPHVTVEDYNGCDWQPCSEEFHAAFVKEFSK